ncbi:SCO3374 family protein [Streptomyces sp. 378]|uniref:SCO3374 family protein n=1 Tax=Streptomyces sp. 378 TaxID=3049412 RepID=UPI0024C301B9|nr:SCO3374 family protein [Streptomyces sp. 378]MDK1341754.1 SCO3374 family protein [Streptomyces sp. 378]
MFQTSPPVIASATPLVPLPRRPLDPAGSSGQVRRWYENELGWPTVHGEPPRLVVGVRYDVLDVPAEAGHAALRRSAAGSPVALHGDRMLLLVAAGSAEEIPGLLEWLDWGSLPLDLVPIGADGLIEAPSPPVPDERRAVPAPCGPNAVVPCRPRTPSPPGAHTPLGDALPPGPPGRAGSQGAAVWLRPPEPGCEVEASLPTLSALGGAGDAPDLVRLVNTVATQCHRVRLRRASAQPPAMRAQGR